MPPLIIYIWSHSRHASEPWIPTLHYNWILSLPAHRVSSVGHWTFRCRRGSSRSNPANIWIYPWSVCEGRRLNAISVMLHVNLSFGGRCPPHTYHRCTALADKYPHLTEFWLRSVFGPCISNIIKSLLSFGLHNRAAAWESEPQKRASAQQFCRWPATPAHLCTTLPRTGLNWQRF